MRALIASGDSFAAASSACDDHADQVGSLVATSRRTLLSTSVVFILTFESGLESRLCSSSHRRYLAALPRHSRPCRPSALPEPSLGAPCSHGPRTPPRCSVGCPTSRGLRSESSPAPSRSLALYYSYW